MACNCGKAKQTYTVTTTSGQTWTGVSEATANLLVLKNPGATKTPTPK